MGWGQRTIEGCMTAWFDEHVNYTQMGLNPLLANANMDPIAQANNLGPIGHFTAMVYFNTTHLGCSKARDEQAVTYGVVYACNYSPPGNIVTRHRGTNRMVALPAYPVVFNIYTVSYSVLKIGQKVAFNIASEMSNVCSIMSG